MARIGLSDFRYGILTEATDGTPTYGVAKMPGHAISFKCDISSNSAKLYGDNVLIESDTSFQSGSCTMGIDKDDIETMSDLLGHRIVTDGTGDTATKTLVRNADDVAPYVGVGRILTLVINNVKKYKVEFLNKVKFAEPSQDNATKGESVEFGTYELTGDVSALANGDWSKSQVFATRAEAVTYLEGLFTASV
jgi:phi13 family phage major tail protein